MLDVADHDWPDESPLRRGRAVLQGAVHHAKLGRVAYAHNPELPDALVLLSRRAEALLHAAEGQSGRDLLQQLGHAGDAKLWRSELGTLLRNGMLYQPGAVRPPRADVSLPRVERVFNAWLHLTNACNLACPYCYIHKSKRHLSDHVVETLLAAIESTAEAGEVDRIHVRYAGGEPLLRFEVLQRFHADALVRCAAHGVRYSAAVLTNGTAIRPEMVDWLRAQEVAVSVSIDGVGAAQDQMRPVVGGGSSWERVQRGIALLQAGGITPYILITVGESNLDALPQLTDWLLSRQLGFRYSLVRDLSWGSGLLNDRQGAAEMAGRKPDGAAPARSVGMLTGPSLLRLQRVLGECYDRIEASVADAVTRGQPVQPGFRRSHKFCDLSPWQPIQQACGAGRSYLAVGDDGAVSPCQAALHEPGTLPLDQRDLRTQARNQTQLQPFVRNEPNLTCRDCRHRASCAGGCPLLLLRREGHVNGRSPYCDVFRAVLPRLVRIAALELAGQRQLAVDRGAHA